jgi:hypothetical protein
MVWYCTLPDESCWRASVECWWVGQRAWRECWSDWSLGEMVWCCTSTWCILLASQCRVLMSWTEGMEGMLIRLVTSFSSSPSSCNFKYRTNSNMIQAQLRLAEQQNRVSCCCCWTPVSVYVWGMYEHLSPKINSRWLLWLLCFSANRLFIMLWSSILQYTSCFVFSDWNIYLLTYFIFSC